MKTAEQWANILIYDCVSTVSPKGVSAVTHIDKDLAAKHIQDIINEARLEGARKMQDVCKDAVRIAQIPFPSGEPEYDKGHDAAIEGCLVELNRILPEEVVGG